MNTHRLLKLARFLKTVPRNKFDLGSWRSPCGTTACAVGWAATIFRKQGLILKREPHLVRLRQWFPEFEGLNKWDAVMAFFGITKLQAYRLFSYCEYRHGSRTGPKAVATQIEKFVKAKSKSTL